MPAQIVVKTLEAPLQSDGDPTHRPGANLGRWLVELQPILNDLGFYYMRENLDFVEPNTFYTFDKLPDGYECYGKQRANNPEKVDIYFYGHPSHRPFRSIGKFLDHVTWLKEHLPGEACACGLC